MARAYLVAQGLGGLGWWLVLWGWQPAREPFLAGGAPDSTLLAFAAADLVFFVGGSLAAAACVGSRHRWAAAVLWTHAGAASYAAMYCLLLAWMEPGAWLGAAMMSPSLVVPLLIASHNTRQRSVN